MDRGDPRVLRRHQANLVDRAIEYFAPQVAFRRMRARAAMALAGGYSGASRSRQALANYRTRAADADSDIIPDLPELISRSRDLSRNSPIGGGAINTTVANVVGRGLSAQPSIDYELLGLSEDQADEWEAGTKREWLLCSESTDIDATRTQGFHGLQNLGLRAPLESGDVFVLPLMRKRALGSPYRLALQFVEADRCSNPGRKRDTPGLTAGVEMDELGAPVAYHFTRTHPGSLLYGRGALEWDRYPAFGERTGRRQVLHLFERTRPGQTRGVPYLAPVIELLKQVTRYTEAELGAAVSAGAHAVFIKMDPEAFENLFNESAAESYLTSSKNWDGTIAPADTLDGHSKAINLLPGEEAQFPQLSRPNPQFDPFMLAIVRQIGLRLDIPYEVLVKHFTASYSAAQAALLDAWRFFRRRRAWLVSMLCQPVYELFLEEAVARGRIAAPGFFADPLVRAAWSRALWTGDGPGSIDPKKDAEAADARIESGVSTISAESIRWDGEDWETKHRQRAREQRLRERDGLVAKGAVPVAPGSAPAAPAAPAEDKPDDAGDLEGPAK